MITSLNSVLIQFHVKQTEHVWMKESVCWADPRHHRQSVYDVTETHTCVYSVFILNQ